MITEHVIYAFVKLKSIWNQLLVSLVTFYSVHGNFDFL